MNTLRARNSKQTLGRGGFTLLEILIATAILTIGLASIVALFPVAINVGRKVIETSNATVIGQSVAESIRDSIRNRKRQTPKGRGVYFVFQHDGVMGKIPPSQKLENPRHDYYILLPQHRAGKRFTSGRAIDRRIKSLKASKVFIYPETSSPPNGFGDAARAVNDDPKGEFWTTGALRVTKTFKLGQKLLHGASPSGAGALADVSQDVLKQYSYAFAITPSFFDANLSSQSKTFMPANKLYHIRVMIYRNFLVSEYTEPPKPVYELDFEVSL